MLVCRYAYVFVSSCMLVHAVTCRYMRVVGMRVFVYGMCGCAQRCLRTFKACMYGAMRTWVYVRMHVCLDAYIYSWNACAFVGIRVHPCTCVSVCICICVGVSMCVCHVTQASHRPRRLPRMHERSPTASRAYVNACICVYMRMYASMRVCLYA